MNTKERELVLDNYDYIAQIAKSVCYKCRMTDYIDIRDKIQDAYLIACDTVNTFDPNKSGIKTFLNLTIRRGLYRIIIREKAQNGLNVDIIDYDFEENRTNDFWVTDLTATMDSDVKLMIDKALDSGMRIQELYEYFVKFYNWSWYYCKQVCATVKTCLAGC